MAASLPDLVDCAALAEESVALERVFELADLPRVQDLLAEPQGTVLANFEFAKVASGESSATVTVHATPRLVCQRCMLGFALPVSGASEVSFAEGDAPQAGGDVEFFRMRNGLVSLTELAEEELLLALPLAAACSTPLTCGQAPSYAKGEAASELTADGVSEMRRPFSALQDLLKKT